ncbi:PREDICTED: ATP-dependent DNA helicase Q4 isoform X1 [Dinoponera quadriceps]|uniref:DNA 3'-5' helicase n=1 Tax=Dinoponera quadriceps TaxID=609295 RepID=A0A6P3Y807_DINQU|nr:PREDICTED: ATP-dependent DNA helicase Q4 isoform X1 [Dinoponera quadriceps]
MEFLENPAFKTKYFKNKLRVKLWESDFMEKYGRKPNKNDIREADATIKESYKMYWKLKTRALEETLVDITFCDDVTRGNVANGSPQKPASVIDEKHEEKPRSPEKKIARDAENVCPRDSKSTANTRESSVEKSTAGNVKEVWGDHLSKNKDQAPRKKQPLLIGRSPSFQLSRNKFESSAFAKRNPRKSLSSARLKIKKPEEVASSDPSVDHTETSDSGNVDRLGAADQTTPVFDESTKVTFEASKPALHRPINVVQQLADGQPPGRVNRNLNQGWLERCTRDSNLEMLAFVPQRLSSTSDSGVESLGSSIHSPMDPASTVNHPAGVSSQTSDEEDFVCNSDSEEERRNKRVGNLRKRLGDRENRPVKRRCVEVRSPSDTTVVVDAVELARSVDGEAKVDGVDAPGSIPDVNAGLNFSDESVRILQVPGDPRVGSSDAVVRDEVTIGDASRADRAASESASSAKREDSPGPAGKPRSTRRRASRRREKQAPSDDSDYAEESKTSKKVRAKMKKGGAGKSSAVRKAAGQARGRKQLASVGGKARARRSARLQVNPKEDERDSDSGSRKVPVYGVETIETVPRFAMKPTGTGGDLVARFSESLCTVVQSERDAPSKASDKEARLAKKMAAGTMNDNFVRINLKKKVFVRGKKNFNLSKYKRHQWKQRKRELTSSESNLDAADLIDKNGATCFKCGQPGHFSGKCALSKGGALLPLEEIDEESSSFPTLEEAEKMANAVVTRSRGIGRLSGRPSLPTVKSSESRCEGEEVEGTELLADDFADDFADSVGEKDTLAPGHRIPQELLSRLLPPEKETIDPLYPVREDGGLVETPAEVLEALRMFGHDSFRPGQEKAVMRVLSGRSTLVTLSTGSGKSLCYQLPAYLYSRRSRCITLVVSPLVSLMDDQVAGMPPFLAAACLHTGQNPRVRELVTRAVREGDVNVLLVSPEAVVAGEKSTVGLLRQLPPIAFACIDEAHCISQWSHNFRPSYLMLCRVLREKLAVKTVLGLTATATRMTAASIARHLDLPDGVDGVVSDAPLPGNLVLSVSKDGNRDQALIALLRSERFHGCCSVIVYCTRREECARIAGFLRTSLQDPRNPEKPNVKVSTIAEAYHAGMTAYRRKVVQKEFMNGRIKIVVATVAFGMGINKSDIRAVIHYNMPGTFEGYVQEVGRAGRDGLVAHCHLFLNPTEDSDKWELRRHVHANGVDRYTIRHLLQRIFIPCSCAKMNAKHSEDRRCPGHEVALPINETVQALDLTEETISTLLCYLELHPKRFVTVLSSVYTRARVSSYSGPQALKQAARSSPPLAMAIALDMQKGITHENSNVINFPVVEVASAIGWDSGVVKSHLKNLEWTEAADGPKKRSSISVNYEELGLRVKAPGDLTDGELDEALDALIAHTQSQESSCLRQLEIIAGALDRISVPSIKHCAVLDDDVTRRSDELKETVRKYFQSDFPLSDVDISFQDKVANEQQIAADARSLILCYRDARFTGRAVARIFHGISSPGYPALIWSRCRFWRAHLTANFHGICKIATREILALR